MIGWNNLNFKGKGMFICCIFNLLVSVLFASVGEWVCIVTVFSAAICGMSTYRPDYRYHDAADINNGSK